MLVLQCLCVKRLTISLAYVGMELDADFLGNVSVFTAEWVDL